MFDFRQSRGEIYAYVLRDADPWLFTNLKADIVRGTVSLGRKYRTWR